MDYSSNPFKKPESENLPQAAPLGQQQSGYQQTVPPPPFAPQGSSSLPVETDISHRSNAVITYLKSAFLGELSLYSGFENRTTGFQNLDTESGALYPGLYVLGAASSMGKTTFVHQMADQLAERGEQVLYFSLIQSRFELIIKSLSRVIARKSEGRYGVTELEIRKMANPSEEVREAMDAYASLIGYRLSIVENSKELDVGVGKISEIVRDYIAGNGVRPIVIVDNIQHIASKECDALSHIGKQAIDYNLRALKTLQREEHLTVIAVSNIDTDSYFKHIDFDSFLNTGGIEYTADVIWGLQIQAAKETEKAQTKFDARERFISAKAHVPRKMELICLKNNFGKSTYTCYFDYYPQYNVFLEEKRIEVEKVVVERL
jgi:replicative DNA helicase